jgi:hypothetical protein
MDAYDVLETGNILILPDAPLTLSSEDREVIQNIRQSGRYHKNISYKPQKDKVSGLEKTVAALRERAHGILRRYSESAIACAARTVPRYQDRWHVDYASLRIVEEAGRELPFKKRNDLIHTDAFPTRPTRGGLILRIFFNFHSSRPRVWWISDPFPNLAAQYAEAAGLARIVRRRRLIGGMLFPVRVRSAYDQFMLRFHDYLKGNAEFQSVGPKYRLEFEPGSAWMAFTDVVPHAVESGQFAMEQTLIVARDSLAVPERAPISILEKLSGHALA